MDVRKEGVKVPEQPKRTPYESARTFWAAVCCAGALPVIWTGTAFHWLQREAYWWSSAIVAAVSIAFIILYTALYISRLKWRGNKLHAAVVDSLIRYNPIALAVVDRNGILLEMNESARQLLGYEREQLIGKPFLHRFIDTGGRDQVLRKFELSLNGEPQDTIISVMHQKGFPVDLHVNFSPVFSGGKPVGAAVVCHDISERKRTTERIRYMAYYDDMTGLPNRRSFMNRLNESIVSQGVESGMLAVLYLDLDRFKLINASFGREFGDMLLLQIAERLTRGLSERDVAARMEGDEFAILLHGMTCRKELDQKARDILQTLEEPFELQGVPLHLTVSIGVAIGTREGDNAETLLRKADMALAKVKETGKNDFLVYSDEWDNHSLERLTLQHDLKRAVRRGEFVLHYQPQYHLSTGKIVGVEALIRWQHPDRGLVSPGEFIPLAEESGMIVEIGEWVLQEACRQNKAWQKAGLPPIPVSVNLSIRQFLQQNLTGKVANILAETELQAEYLDLEITETMTIDVGHASRCLLELAKLGVNISIDDFGTGYSSFHYLKKLPIGRLKIDRSFVRDIQQDPGDAAIVAAIIAMAHNLNLQVIAEGVENEDQMRFLQKHACDEMQGYYWSPPVPGGRIAEMLQSGAAP